MYGRLDGEMVMAEGINTWDKNGRMDEGVYRSVVDRTDGHMEGVERRRLGGWGHGWIDGWMYK